MNRSKKLVRNLVIILVILWIFYYYGGYYISKQQCVIETLRGHYATETREVMEVRQGNYIATLMADENNESFSIVGTKKTGILYRTASSSVGNKVDKEKSMTMSGMGSSDYGIIICIYRNDKSIAKVEVQLENGDTYLITDWKEDYAWYVRTGDDDWSCGTYRAYNAKGEQVGEEMYY